MLGQLSLLVLNFAELADIELMCNNFQKHKNKHKRRK